MGIEGITTDDFQAEIQDATKFALEAHFDHFRKHSGLPFIVHPMATLAQLSDWTVIRPRVNLYIWKATLCHDVLEDCPWISFEELVENIGKQAANLVKELSFFYDKDGIEKSVQKRQYLESFMRKSVEALAVKVSDRCCNTIDFMATDHKYAPVYWKKATPLFEAMVNRRQEIIDMFGPASFANMKYTHTTLGQMLS